MLVAADPEVVGGDDRGLGWSHSKVQGKRFGVKPEKLNISSYLTFNFFCSFAHERSEYSEKLVGLLHLKMLVRDASPYAWIHPSVLGITSNRIVIFFSHRLEFCAKVLNVTNLCHFDMLLCRMQTLRHSWSWLCALARHLSYKKLMAWNRCFIHCCVVI